MRCVLRVGHAIKFDLVCAEVVVDVDVAAAVVPRILTNAFAVKLISRTPATDAFIVAHNDRLASFCSLAAGNRDILNVALR
jgi:hypothetical protein